MTPILSRMFPQSAEKGFARGAVLWIDTADEVRQAEIALWKPNEARPNELRLGKIYKIDAWTVDESEFKKSRANKKKWFYLLLLDVNGKVWARLFQEEYLDEQTPLFRDYILRRIKETPAGQAVFGSIDFEAQTTYP